tara:strand:- start:504 stop:656 length:153 start_codon:yes stop_codon:yes gene_type:complete
VIKLIVLSVLLDAEDVNIYVNIPTEKPKIEARRRGGKGGKKRRRGGNGLR